MHFFIRNGYHNITKMNKKTLTFYITGGIIILGLIIAVIYFAMQTKIKDSEMKEMVEVMNFEKEQVEREYIELTYEFDGYTSNIRNDSLFKLLENEKVKVQQLLEELRITKSTNARKINDLKNELATVRRVMAHLVTQIDSLNAENKVLRTENIEVKRRYTQASETVQQLSKERESLTEVVTRASKLEVTDFNFTQLNNRNRRTTVYSQIANLQFNFTVSKNITATPGNKTVYLRIMRPDDEVMTKNANNVFAFENKYITYSSRKDFEYTSEAYSDVIYWKVEEILQVGTYRADFFIDGNRVGSFTFAIKK